MVTNKLSISFDRVGMYSWLLVPKNSFLAQNPKPQIHPLGMIPDGRRQLLFYSCRNNIIWPNAQEIKTLGFTSTLAWLYQLGLTCFLDEERFIMQQLRVVIIHGVWISILSRALKRVKVWAHQKSPKLKVIFLLFSYFLP